MTMLYTVIKFVHILIAILALGTSAGLGIVLEFYGQHPKHGAFVLNAISRISLWFVLPGYVAMLATGLWMTHVAWTPVPGWLQSAMALWGAGLVLLIADIAVLRKQATRAVDEGAVVSRWLSVLGRGLGAACGLLVVAILYLMVFKPSA